MRHWSLNHDRTAINRQLARGSNRNRSAVRAVLGHCEGMGKMSAIMTPAELRELTGYCRSAEQRRMLDEYGIPYKSVGSRTIVMSQHVTAWVEGRPVHRLVEPDMSAIT